MPAAFPSLARELILEHGPLSLDQLHAYAVEREITRARSSSGFRSSLSAPGFLLRPDGRYDTAARLLRHACFTTRPRRAPKDGVLWLNRDVDPLLALDLTRLPLASGGEVCAGAGDTPTWVGPAGWLPDVAAGELVVLSWNGTALDVGPAPTVPALDSDAVTDIRRLLAAHASARRRPAFSPSSLLPLTTVILSGLLEDPLLFRTPLPPLSELLPLPEDLRPIADDRPWIDREGYESLQLAVPRRVHRELSRRADLLGDHLAEYAAMLLGAAADRLLATDQPRYDRYTPYDDLDAGNVVAPARWRY